MDAYYKVEFFGENGWELLTETIHEQYARAIADREFSAGSDVRVTASHRHSVRA